MAIDKATLVPAIYGPGGRAIKNPLPPQLWSYNDDVRDHEFDLPKAQKLMVEAGFPQGFDTDLWYMPVTRPYNPDSKRMGEMIAEDLSRIGVRARLVTAPWGEYSAKLQAGLAPMAIYGWIGDNGDPDNFLSILLGCHDGKPGPNNITKWCDPSLRRADAGGHGSDGQWCPRSHLPQGPAHRTRQGSDDARSRNRPF